MALDTACLPATTKRQTFNPILRARQFRAWQFCQVNGTEMTIRQLAERLNEDHEDMRRALRDEKWARELRSSSHAYGSGTPLRGEDADAVRSFARQFVGTGSPE